MTIPNDNEQRHDIQVAMTPIEALLTLESYSIGAASMLAYTNRDRRQMDHIQAMRRRLIDQIGLPARATELLADSESGIFRLAEFLQNDVISEVSFRLDPENATICCAIDGKDRPFTRLDLTREEETSISGETHWEQRQGRKVALWDAYASVMPSILSFVQDLASMRVAFSVETEFTVEIPRSLVTDRSETSLRSVIDDTLQRAFSAMGPTTGLTKIDHDLWSDRPTVVATIRALVPAVVQEEATSTFEASLPPLAATAGLRP